MTDSEAQREGDKVSLEASADGVKLNASGSIVSDAGAALLDSISPFTNAAGYIGDRIADARRTAALRSAKKAKEMLGREGITSGDVPPKIMLPWLEGASLELDDDDVLQTAWAGLLARAVKSSDAVVISYIEVLKKIGADEAELLDFFAGDTNPGFSSKFYSSDFPPMISHQNTLFGGMLEKFDQMEIGVELEALFNDFGIQGMCQVIFFALNNGRLRPTKFFDQNEHAVSNLEHLGLIKICRETFETENRTYSFVWFEITKFAFDLFWACQGKVTGAAHSLSAGTR